MIVSSFVSYIC